MPKYQYQANHTFLLAKALQVHTKSATVTWRGFDVQEARRRSHSTSWFSMDRRVDVQPGDVQSSRCTGLSTYGFRRIVFRRRVFRRSVGTPSFLFRSPDAHTGCSVLGHLTSACSNVDEGTSDSDWRLN